MQEQATWHALDKSHLLKHSLDTLGAFALTTVLLHEKRSTRSLTTPGRAILCRRHQARGGHNARAAGPHGPPAEECAVIGIDRDPAAVRRRQGKGPGRGSPDPSFENSVGTARTSPSARRAGRRRAFRQDRPGPAAGLCGSRRPQDRHAGARGFSFRFDGPWKHATWIHTRAEGPPPELSRSPARRASNIAGLYVTKGNKNRFLLLSIAKGALVRPPRGKKAALPCEPRGELFPPSGARIGQGTREERITRILQNAHLSGYSDFFVQCRTEKLEQVLRRSWTLLRRRRAAWTLITHSIRGLEEPNRQTFIARGESKDEIDRPPRPWRHRRPPSLRHALAAGADI